MSEEKKPLGVATFLPEDARKILVRAAERVRKLPEWSNHRPRILREAIEIVRGKYPHLFRKESFWE